MMHNRTGVNLTFLFSNKGASFALKTHNLNTTNGYNIIGGISHLAYKKIQLQGTQTPQLHPHIPIFLHISSFCIFHNHEYGPSHEHFGYLSLSPRKNKRRKKEKNKRPAIYKLLFYAPPPPPPPPPPQNNNNNTETTHLCKTILQHGDPFLHSFPKINKKGS